MTMLLYALAGGLLVCLAVALDMLLCQGQFWLPLPRWAPQWLRCRTFNHALRVELEYAPWLRKARCVACGREFGMNDHVQAILPWDAEMERFHRMLFRRDWDEQ